MDAASALQHAELPLVVLVALEEPQTPVRLLDFIGQAPLVFDTFFDDLVMSSSTSLRAEVVEAPILIVYFLLRLG